MCIYVPRSDCFIRECKSMMMLILLLLFSHPKFSVRADECPFDVGICSMRGPDFYGHIVLLKPSSYRWIAGQCRFYLNPPTILPANRSGTHPISLFNNDYDNP